MVRSSTKPKKATKAKTTKAKKTARRSGTQSGHKDPAAVCDAVFRFMCEEHSFGMTEWTREELASAVGFNNCRTEKFTRGLQILMKQKGLAENGSKKGTLVISPRGVAQKPPESQPKTLEDVHNRFIEQLRKKAASGPDKVPLVWEILKGRQWHDIKDIAKTLGYGNPNSFKNTKIMKLMEQMGIVKREKSRYQMTDKAFPSELTSEATVEF